jgi:hypothetical protein
MSQQISPLRQRMIDDMTMRNMATSTQANYIRAVANFSIFHGCSPDKLGAEVFVTIDFTSSHVGSSRRQSMPSWAHCGSFMGRP